MSYVEKILQPGETVRHKAHIHWFIYLPALVFGAVALIIVGLVTMNIGEIGTNWRVAALIAAALFGLVALYLLLRASIERFSTELVATDRRIIYKRGLIRRFTAEMNMEKVETVLVEQGILGRIFGYGTITIRGTGGGMEPLPNIDDPLTFRNHVTAD
jgi:uncharacterized membrane protein YdbT with pleckstrin-like domain